MPDLFDPLRGTPDLLVRPPLPADEVRRRGDRMRRRRTLAAATGATLAVALVVGGGLALGGGFTSGAGPAPLPPATQAPDPPEPTPTTASDWRIGIPAGFPLADDLGDVVSSSEEELAGPGRDVRVFDVPFDACGRSTDLGAPVDTLAVRHTAPEWFDGRVLQVYGDDTAARAVLEELVGMYDACPKDLFEGPPYTVVVSTVRPVPLGEEGYLVTRTFSVDDLRVPGLELLHLVRVGNALLVTNLSNEGGATDASVARQLGEREPVVADVAAAMCTFAENGCGGGDAEGGDTSPLAAAVLGLAQVRELTRGMNTSWAAVGDRRPVLSCQPVPLSTLEPRGEASAFFDGTGRTGVVNAQAAGAVLELPDVALAEQAFASVSGWLRDCADEGSAAQPVAIAHDPVTQKTGWGPATWRVVERPAPEICTECDTGWIDAQGVVLVGNRLALVSLAWTGDMGSGADAAGSPMNDAVETAARLAAGSAPTTEGPVFGPRGLGPVHLGMSPADVESSGAVLEDSHGQGCTTFTAEPEGNRVLGFLTENQGVSVLLVDEEGVLTPGGVGIGTTEKRVRAAYPDAEAVPMGLLVPVPGFGDREYTFAFEDGRLVEMALRLDRQPCVG